MLARLAIALALTAACTADPTLTVSVSSGADPLRGAVVACVCDPPANAGGVTGDDGVARLVVWSGGPGRCLVTVSRDGYRTEQLEVEVPIAVAVSLEAVR